MPFTLSHAAAVWPFQRTRLVLSALLIGSFAPDFAYFFFVNRSGRFAHTLEGAIVIDLPLSLIVLWLFQSFIKQPATQLLPRGFRARLKPEGNRFAFWPPRRLALIVVSILIGTATHIFWDSFTHPFYWPYRHLSFLNRMVYLPIQGEVQMYKALQTGSTLFGLAVVAVWIALWYRSTKPVESQAGEPYSKGQILVITIAVPLLAFALALIKAYEDQGIPVIEFRPVLHFALAAAIATITFSGIGLLICGAFFRTRVSEPA
ncbi:MAG TPA: DUF4184 family protein [Terracidiphilus sp.]|jgi:hypothetical protein